MLVEDTPLAGVKLITPRRFGDHRGFFSESYSAKALAGHGIDDHQYLIGTHRIPDGSRLIHHRHVDMETSRRIDDHEVPHGRDGLFDTGPRDGHGIRAVPAIDRDPELRAERLQLVGRGGAVNGWQPRGISPKIVAQT